MTEQNIYKPDMSKGNMLLSQEEIQRMKGVKKKHGKLSIETTNKVAYLREEGYSLRDIAKILQIGKSSVCTIIKELVSKGQLK